MTSDKRHPLRADDESIKLLSMALEEFAQDGKVTGVHCDVCGDLIQIKQIADEAYFADCQCGKFRGSLRGL